MTSVPTRTSGRGHTDFEIGGFTGGMLSIVSNLGENVYFPRFLIGMTASLVVTMGWIYAATGSPWLSLAWTLAAALLLQTGYFIAVLIMVFGRRILQAHRPFSPSSRTNRQITSGKHPRRRAGADLER